LALVVYTAGTWDLFHVGHLRLIQRCADYGYLIVGVSTDDLVEQCKGKRPFVPYDERFEIVQSIRHVDCAVRQSEFLDFRDMIRFRMDILILGDDWKDSDADGITWARKEKQFVFLPRTPYISTSIIKDRLKHIED